MKPVEFTAEAAAEVEEQVEFLEGERLGLGSVFLDELEDALAFLRQFPEAGGPEAPFEHRGAELRRKRVGRFNLWLVYWNRNTVVILALKHGSRHPDYWKDRLL